MTYAAWIIVIFCLGKPTILSITMDKSMDVCTKIQTKKYNKKQMALQ